MKNKTMPYYDVREKPTKEYPTGKQIQRFCDKDEAENFQKNLTRCNYPQPVEVVYKTVPFVPSHLGNNLPRLRNPQRKV